MKLHDILCLDFEASALGRCGYPIEVAIVDCGTLASQAWLIKPDEDWLRNGLWSEESAKVHNISQAQLHASGQSAAHVAHELNRHCSDKRVVCDGGEHDRLWLAMLFIAGSEKPLFKLDDYPRCVADLATRWGKNAEQVIASAEREAWNRYPTSHRAPADARRLAECLRLTAAGATEGDA